jgi:hypothetical protein
VASITGQPPGELGGRERLDEIAHRPCRHGSADVFCARAATPKRPVSRRLGLHPERLGLTEDRSPIPWAAASRSGRTKHGPRGMLFSRLRRHIRRDSRNTERAYDFEHRPDCGRAAVHPSRG